MSTFQKTINLLLDYGTLEGMVDVIDNKWQNGELFSCPREKIEDLLAKPEINRYGVYLLISQDKVYVGQSSNLKARITQHIVGKDWWERAVVLTTKDDSFNKSDIDYLESVLIQKSTACGTLDSENKNKGNKQKVDKFRKPTLDEYIDEALFVLQLIGVTVFSEKKGKAVLVKTVPASDPQEIELRHKAEVADFARKNGANIGDSFSYASLQERRNWYWINPRVECIDSEWVILLNNQIKKEITVLTVPANTFALSKTLKKGVLLVRRDKTYYIDLNIKADSLKDRRTDCDFSSFVSARIKY